MDEWLLEDIPRAPYVGFSKRELVHVEHKHIMHICQPRQHHHQYHQASGWFASLRLATLNTLRHAAYR